MATDFPEIWDGKLANLLKKVRPNAHTVLDIQMLPIPADTYRDRAMTRDLLEHVDVLLVDRKEAVALTKKQDLIEAARMLADYGSRIITIKLGSQGCLVFSKGDLLWSEPLLVNARDLIGAGDYFGAAFSFGLLSGWPLQKIANFANAFAALCAARNDGDPLPGQSYVFSYMKSSANG